MMSGRDFTMLNDYEITRVENTNAVHPILSLLKLIACAVAIVCSIILVPDVINGVNESRESLVEDSLKIRVVANSNTVADQELKTRIVENLTPFFSEIQRNEQANRDNDEVYAQLSNYVEKYYAQEKVTINVGDNLIPPKLESAEFYPQYYYNSLVVTIGDGRGDNWWCSIFNNVCEGSAQKDKDENKDEKKANAEEEEKTKVTFIVWEWFKKLFS
jgi:stage II sporulation protein R